MQEDVAPQVADVGQALVRGAERELFGVYLVDCRFDDADLFLKQMQGWFGEHLPGVRAELIRLSSVYTRDDPETWQKIKATGDAAIVGVGH